uniref:photosystem II subunit M n=1 Tax=Streblus asper TaxID=648879 RepID=UPI0030E0504A
MGLNPELLRIKEKRNDEIMEVNILAFIATALFILIPTAFLLIIYVKTVSQSD